MKTYPAEKGLESVSQGLQVLGGYGFCMDFILQQYYRDIRIISIYEGTTGIQSLDLLGRKVGLHDGKVLEMLGKEVQTTIMEAMKHESLQPYAQQLGASLGQVQEVLGALMRYAKKGDFERYLADATLFMDFFGTLIIAWQWLKIGVAVQGKTGAFYEGKLHTMKFFFKYELSRTKGLSKVIMDELDLTVDMELDYLD